MKPASWDDQDDSQPNSQDAFKPLTAEEAQALRLQQPNVSLLRVVLAQVLVGLVSAVGAAADVTAWNQLGCLSPHVFYMQRGGEISPEHFAQLLAEELEHGRHVHELDAMTLRGSDRACVTGADVGAASLRRVAELAHRVDATSDALLRLDHDDARTFRL